MRDLKAHIIRHYGRILQTHEKIVVGVSGGADSVALLHLLTRIVGHERLAVAHLDHGWRGGSANDAAFVRETAVSTQIPYHGAKLQAQPASGLEAAGRGARYRFFADVARCEGATAIAVAHHADDQAETVMMNLLRGSGLDGLGGMATQSPLFTDEAIVLLRPFLHIRRSEIEAYCAEHELAYRNDPTNNDTHFLRNKIRQEIMPLLAEGNAGIVPHLATLAEAVQQDVALLQQVTVAAWQNCVVENGAGWVRLQRDGWANQPVALQRRLLRTAVFTLNYTQTDLSFAAVEAARLGILQGHFGTQFDLAGGVSAMLENGTILLRVEGAESPLNLPLLPDGIDNIALPVPSTVQLANGWEITAVWLETPNIAALTQNENPWQVTIAPQFTDLTIRARQDGEKMQPLGMNGRSTTLKKIFKEHRIPADVRHRWPLVACDEHAIWIAGHKLDHRARLNEGHDRAIVLTLQPIKNDK